MRISEPPSADRFAGRKGRCGGTRHTVLALCLLGGACHSADPAATGKALARVEAEQRTRAEDDGMVLCAQADAALTRSCTVEQTPGSDGLILTIRRPDGGFHRLLATRDGRGVVAADGAQPARVSVVGADSIDVRLGDDHYRLPATVKR